MNRSDASTQLENNTEQTNNLENFVSIKRRQSDSLIKYRIEERKKLTKRPNADFKGKDKLGLLSDFTMKKCSNE